MKIVLIVLFSMAGIASTSPLPKDIACAPDEFLCPSGIDKRSGDSDYPCIPKTWINDGKTDCLGGYDEKADTWVPDTCEQEHEGHQCLRLEECHLNETFIDPADSNKVLLDLFGSDR